VSMEEGLSTVNPNKYKRASHPLHVEVHDMELSRDCT
jgi:hypothetical protein